MHGALCLGELPRVAMDATSRMDVFARSFLVRKTWFHGLAMTLGVTAIPSIASAQNTFGDTGGLSASSFSARALPPPPNSNSAVRNYLAPQSGQTSLAAYAQNGVVGSGIPNGHVHVPGSAIDNSVLNSQYQSAPQYAPQVQQPYEQMQLQGPQHAQPGYSTPYAAPAQ